MRARHALAREVSARFSDAVMRQVPALPVNVPLARVQHAAYVCALRNAGCAVTVLPPLADFPDCVFVEDCAVVLGDHALITRPGAASRRGEVDSVAVALRDFLTVTRMEEPATADGGDCMLLGNRLFVGRSSRTNAEGLAALTAFAGSRGVTVVAVEVRDGLHLKSVCSPLDDGDILLAQGTVDPAAFPDVKVLMVPRKEAAAANVVCVNGHALMAQGNPQTRVLLLEAGFRVVELDVSETAKADGALTCMSILVP